MGRGQAIHKVATSTRLRGGRGRYERAENGTQNREDCSEFRSRTERLVSERAASVAEAALRAKEKIIGVNLSKKAGPRTRNFAGWRRETNKREESMR